MCKCANLGEFGQNSQSSFSLNEGSRYLVNGRENFFRDLLTTSDIVITIRQDLRLYDWHNSSALTDGSVTGQHVGVLQDGEFARSVFRDLQNASPLGKVASVLLVLDTTSLEIVETLGRAFVVGAEERNDALVDFDTGDDVALLQQFDEWRTIVGFLIEGLVEEDYSRNVLSDDILGRTNVKRIY